LVVLDASLVVALFLNEDETAAAEALVLGEARRPLASPDLLALEVGSALTRRVRRRLLAPEHVGPLMSRLARLAIRRHPHAPLLGPALDLSLAHRHALPDCLYLALAREEGAALATFDRRLAALAERLSIPLWSPDATQAP
jgi:predicted nucleic acid-binding protein